ncbi:amino acid adenylation domain-containing protein [Burkholderia stagnalis]
MTTRMLKEMDDVERELLALLADDNDRHTSRDADPDSDTVPLSAAQRNIWFLQQYDRTSTAYNLDRVFVVDGELDVPALRRALQYVCDRHEILRTRIVADGGQPRQVVDDAFRFPLTVEPSPAGADAGGLPQTIAGFARRHVSQPFDLAAAPPVRGALLALEGGRTLVALSMHHILSDAWSNPIWMSEIATAYESFRHGREPALRPLPAQYRHYVARQHDYLAGDQYASDVAYWRDYLGDGSDVLRLPDAGSRCGVDDTWRFRFALPPDSVGKLDAYCAKLRVSRFAVLLGVWQVLLGKLSNQSSFHVGVPNAGRLWPDVEHLIGCFVNTHVYRARLAPDLTLDEVVRAVHASSVAAMNHGNVPFDALVGELGVKRAADENPLFQILFDFKVSESARLTFGDASASLAPLPAAQRKFDLTLSVSAAAEAVECEFEYAASRFGDDAVSRWGDAYLSILDALLVDGRRCLGNLTVLDSRERASLLGLSRVDARYDEGRPVHRVIQAQAAATPDAVAVEFGDAVLTYRELDVQANRLARRLIALGVGPEVRVGIAVERSVEMVVGLLAILKAGGAYVPLDPEYPRDRLAYMIEDSGIALLLTQSHVRGSLPVPAGLTTLDLDTVDLSSKRDSDPEVTVDVENVAYVIYTSGSTGRPKGAANRHSALTNRLVWMQSAYGLDGTDTVLQKTPFSFDVSVWEFFWPLMVGAKLAVAQPGDHRDPAKLVSLIGRHGVTTLHFVPSMLQAFVAHDGAANCTGLKRIVCSGEALPAELANRTLDLLPEVGLYNLYGPTEAAIDVTHWTCVPGAESVPIGRPIDNAQTYVLDDALNLAPLGVAGELYLGGAGLARGYLNRPSLTAERFVPDPFGKHGERLYRTGDLARWNAEGALEYLGRIDHQVKIRGFRIELGEIEAQLSAQAEVREAVVTAQEGPGGTRLVAYVTASEHDTIDVAKLRASLSSVLPDYMVPGVIMVLERMPLNPNGKVDRKSLPKAEAESAAEYEAPQGETEESLAAIWRDVLNVGRIGRHDNFFELGGDSILSLQIVARARDAGWKITPRQMFERQTVALLSSVAQRVDEQATHEAEIEQGDVPLLPIQSWFFETPMANRHHWNQAVLLKGTQSVDRDVLGRALEAVVGHHGALRLRYTQDEAGVWQQAYTAGTAPDVLLWERNASDTTQIAALCDEAQRSLNLTDGPLLRALLIRLPDGDWRLLLAIHHLAVDGVSWRILLDDLQSAYGQALVGDSIKLPSNGTPYQAWAKRLVEHAKDKAVSAELPYWQSVLDAPSKLPTDRPNGANTIDEQRTTTVELDREATRRLLQDAPSAYRTQINDVLLTALGRALCGWTDTEAIRIDLEGHGREDLFDDVDLSRTVGWFTSLYPVKLAPQGEPGDALKRVKESLRNVPQRGLGFGLLKYLGTDSDRAALSDATPSSVVFNYLGQFDRSFASETGWQPAEEASGRAQDPDSGVTHELSIGAKVFDGTLSISLSYSGARHDEATVAGLLDAYLSELHALIAHCTSGATGATPSDFPLAKLTQSELDALPMPSASIEDLYPLSPMQSGMLFHTLYAPTGSAYLNQLRIDVDGLEVARFRAAWEAVTARHSILRTGFVQQGDAWLQWVAREVTLPFTEHDWLNRPDRAAALDALATGELSRGFDMTVAPLQRIVLIRTEANRHHLIWTHHHVLMDGWSVSQLMGEVLRHYDGRKLPAQGGRYRDYIEWLQRRDAGASETYWRGVLSTLDEPTRLTTAPSQADAESGQGEHVLTLSEASTAQLTAFARACRVTVNTLVQGAWSLILQRHTGQKAVVFGATVAGRPGDLAGAEQLLGLFINTVPVVRSARGDQRVGEWLQALQAQGVASQEHAHTPLYEIQRWSGAGPEGLFDTLVVFENYPVDEALKETAPGGLSFGELGFREETNYPLTLGVTLTDRLEVATSYARARIDGERVGRLAAQLERVLTAFVELGASAHLGDVSLLDDVERNALLAAGRNDAANPRADLVHERIGAQAIATPDAVAVVYDETSLTYRELDTRANRVAHRLIALGVGPETRVGIAIERSVDMVVGILATLKAGGAYVPLDPDYPRERLAYMLEDSGVELVLTQSGMRDSMPVPEGVTTILDLDTLDVSNEPASAPDVKVNGDNLAYVIYTSGSTGKPKGVGLPHRAFARHVQVSVELFGIEAEDRVLQFSTLNFDGFVEQLFPPLTVGARVVLRGPTLWDSVTFREQVVRHGITVADVTTAYWQLLVQDLENGSIADLGGLRRLHAGGEAMSPQTLHVWRHTSAAGVELANTYGPTEATVTASAYECEASSGGSARLQTVPIGRALGGRKLYLLDEMQSLVPRGAIGELCIGGALLARGYLNRPGQTAERFVPDPFGAAGARLYRTGDLARWNAGGELEYVGRIDHQVKVRGFQIELGEIDAQLLAQPDVREAITIAQSRADGVRLVAYVSGQAEGRLEGQALRVALAQALPDYMVPSVIVVLDALPLNPNGKVDRHALPEAEVESSSAYEAPRGEAEQTLAEIWREVLGVERVGRHDNFFELGGHSLLALQVQRRVYRQLAVEIPLQAFFSNGGLQDLAATLLVDRATSMHAKQQAITDMQALLDDLID